MDKLDDVDIDDDVDTELEVDKLKKNQKHHFKGNNNFSFLLVCQLQVLCRHHRQYQHHRVYPLRQGNCK